MSVKIIHYTKIEKEVMIKPGWPEFGKIGNGLQTEIRKKCFV